MTTYYSADFETTVPDEEDESINTLETRVWSWGICELNRPETFMYGTTIESFVEWCSRDRKRVIYFHNLKFDGKFLIDFLIRSGYVYDPDKKKNNSFNTLISQYGQFYAIEIVFKVYSKSRHSTIFYDSTKKIPLSIAQISESFNLELKKGTIDYKKERPEGYEPTQDELDYLKNDVAIMSEALHMQHEQGLKRMTIGGDALYHYRKIVGTENYNRWFPNIYDENGQMFIFLKMYYKGGYTYVNPKYQGQDIGEGVTYDVTSLYPSVMKNELMPWGQPIIFKGKYNENFKEFCPLYCQCISAEFKLKKDHLPFAHDRSGYFHKSIEYIEETEMFKAVSLFLTNMELELFFEHYDIITIEYCGGAMFNARHGMFDDYIDYWTNVKEQATKDGNKGLRQISKLMLNSLYGKFGKNVFMGGKFPQYCPDKDKVLYVDKKVEIVKGSYMPIAIFTTAYGRVKMIRGAQANYDRFLYCDTDSQHIHGLEEPKGIEVHPYKLGAWKYEGAFKRARFLRPKAYIHEYDNNILDVKCAGMPENIKPQVTFDNFQFGFTAHGKKMPKTIRGGVFLRDTTFTLMQ